MEFFAIFAEDKNTMKKNILVLFVSLCLGAGIAKAQYADVLNFNGFNGSEPFGSLTLSGNVLYGTTYYGGVNDSGCIFSIRTDGTHYKDLFDFNGKNGAGPNSPLTIAGGILYGTANAGGAHDSGCVFSIDTNGKNYKDIFDFSGPNGKNPYNTLIYNSGTLYGVADGGANHAGCVFSIDTNGSAYKDIYDFSGYDGRYPLGLTLIKGKLYGTTLIGGFNSYGNIFSINTNGNNYRDLYDFGYIDGAEPYGALTYNGAGSLYGAAAYGGANGFGLIFSLDTNGNNYADRFDFSGTNGAQPEFAGGSLVLSGNTLFGTAYYGGSRDSGCVFSLDTNGSSYKDLYDFTGLNGSNPEGSLTLVGNTLYGATALGGLSQNGIIFAFDTAIATIAAIHDTVCKGDSAKLFVKGLSGATYKWSPGGATKDTIYASPGSTTTYTVTSKQGVVQYTNTIKVTILPLPTPVITGTSKVCKGSRDTLSISGGTAYKWNNGKTTTSIITGPINADSTEYVTVYNSFGCSVTDSFKIIAEICTGVNEMNDESENVKVYPNPSGGMFTLAFSHPELVSGTQTIEVYNVLGEKVYSQLSIINYPLLINLNGQTNGVYLYRVISETGEMIGEGKIVIEK